MDTFFSYAGLEKKRRVHFYRFMQEIHQRLGELKGTADPLASAARQIAQQARLICFDEFHVSDIADAMLLGRLLQELLARGIVFVMTSNYYPDALYPSGLQRERFLPAIALLKQHLEMVHVNGKLDYRLQTLEKIDVYHHPVDAAAEAKLFQAFKRVAAAGGEPAMLEIEGRKIAAKRCAQGVAWFEFAELCAGPRAPADYIEIARRFHTVLISHIPRMSPKQAAEAKRFMGLIDEFYDRRVKLIVSAEVPPEALYDEGIDRREFTRTVSRLQEMQTHHYLSLAHLP